MNQWGNDKYSVSVLGKTREKSVVKKEMKIVSLIYFNQGGERHSKYDITRNRSIKLTA